MKFPSIKSLADNAASTLKRFPFEVLFAFIGSVAATIEIELRDHSRVKESWCIRTVMIANLGLLLSLSASLYTKSKKISARTKSLIRIAAALVAILLIFIINPAQRQADYTRFFLLSLSFHLLVAFAAFTAKGQLQGFWQFNKTLFLRFLTSVFYGVVLYAGLAAAIGAMNFLFNFKFEWDTFAILWVWIVGIFTTLFFLAGVPTDIRLLDDDLNYPKSLKIFTQYVLIPLSTVYVAILLAYEIKILIEWKLPKGLVSNLVLGYAVFGILSLLLVYPVREQNENKWLKTYARSFYFLLLPLLGLLFVAVGARVFSYGITDYRYFLILLALWLLFISIYFLLFKKQNIKLIPVSLCILTLLATYGPQSAFSVSMYSQRRIVVDFFKMNNAFKDGKIMPVDSNKLSAEEGSRGVANLEYFIYNYDLPALQPYIKKDLNVVSDSLGKLGSKSDNGFIVDRYELRRYKSGWAKDYLGLHHFERYYYKDYNVTTTNGYHFNTDENITAVKGYDFLFDSNLIADTITDKFNGIIVRRTGIPGKAFVLELNNEKFIFNIDDVAIKLVEDPKLDTYHQKSGDEYNVKNYLVPQGMLLFKQQTANYTVSLKIENLRVTKKEKAMPEIQFASATYLVKVK